VIQAGQHLSWVGAVVDQGGDEPAIRVPSAPVMTTSAPAIRISRPSRRDRYEPSGRCCKDHGNPGRLRGLLEDIHRRTGSAEPTLEPALEVWAQVLSVPELGLVIPSAGLLGG
jgi:hypothetical protein